MSYVRRRRLIEKIELEYDYPTKDQLEWFRKYPLRYKDIAAILGCSRMTLRRLFRELDCDGGDKEKVIFDRPNLSTIADDIDRCRRVRKMTVEQTAKALNVSRSTVVKYTPDWLKGTQNLSAQGLEAKQLGAYKTNAKRASHPWSERVVNV